LDKSPNLLKDTKIAKAFQNNFESQGGSVFFHQVFFLESGKSSKSASVHIKTPEKHMGSLQVRILEYNSIQAM